MRIKIVPSSGSLGILNRNIRYIGNLGEKLGLTSGTITAKTVK